MTTELALGICALVLAVIAGWYFWASREIDGH